MRLLPAQGWYHDPHRRVPDEDHAPAEPDTQAVWDELGHADDSSGDPRYSAAAIMRATFDAVDTGRYWPFESWSTHH